MASATTEAARKHVEKIRRTKFSIGGKVNPLTEDLHQAVKNLSAELYAKDVHFLMELIQNAEDNEYPKGVDPSLEFVITSKDITNTGAPATLLVFNNEKGFSHKNIESICSVGRSTKKGLRKLGYIGEKGIGFKSVFLITSQPYIFSNGYHIRFNEKPCQHCNLGYIVPEWVEADIPILSAIQTVYGSATPLPTTTLVLPLKPEKVKPVKDQISSVHPEVLLFLSKIKRLSVREVNHDPKRNTVNAISISSEKNFATSKSMDADSYSLHLTAGDGVNRECKYYMWKQRFPVKPENRVDVRMEVQEWAITLAFPHGERLIKRGGSRYYSAGIYSFLPTETVTNFPFIIQADFLLASSRENILWDNKWNQGILDCVPVAYVNAFTSLVKSKEKEPVSSLVNLFSFLPVSYSSVTKLNNVRDTIKQKLMNETVVPCKPYNNTSQKKKKKKKILFGKPNEVGRLKSAFRSILKNAKSQGVNFSSHGPNLLLASSFDKKEYKVFLDFLGIRYIDNEWYARCISDLVKGVSEDVYIQILVFISENWDSIFYRTSIMYTPLIKYVGRNGKVDLDPLVSGTTNNKRLAADSNHCISWLLNWNTEFGSCKNFLPKVTQEAIQSCTKKPTLVKWLEERANVHFVNVSEYASQLLLDTTSATSVNSNRKLAVTYAHFIQKSLQNRYLKEHEVKDLCMNMPIVDNYGKVTKRGSHDGVLLVPANGSRWIELIGSNQWGQNSNYVELGEDYTRSKMTTHFDDVTSSGEEVISFLVKYVGASDVPYVYPPNAAIPNFYSPLTKTNTFLLLEWLHNLTTYGVTLPERFLTCLKNGSWLKVSLNGSPGYRPPSESFRLNSSTGNLLQNGSVLVDIPLVDFKFYGENLKNYKDELRTIGVRFENAEACEYIGNRLMSLAGSSMLTRDNVISILKFIKYLRANYISPEEFIKSIRGVKWVKTSQGDTTPGNSVLFSQKWSAASQISNIPFIDLNYYGNEILSFSDELELLGVVVKFSNQIVMENLKHSSSLASLSSEAMLLVLTCVKSLESSSDNKLVQAIKNTKCLKTNLGYTCPSECFLLNPESQWGPLLQVFGSFSVLDTQFYGRAIFSMSNELKKIGVMVDFEDAMKEFIRTFKQQASLSSIKKEHVVSFLECYRKLKKLDIKLSVDFQNCVCKEKWIRTRLGDYRSPNECILFGEDWEPIFPLLPLVPFIDDNFYGNMIHTYRVELKGLGVVTNFKDGTKFVATGLFLPQDSNTQITPAIVYSLLESVKKLKEEKETEILAIFREKLSQKNWLKTYFGYKLPHECLLFNSSRDSLLKCNDGPFIDEGFYGPRIVSYRKELDILGVISDTNKECQLLAGYLKCHSNFQTISRIYNFLSKYKWEPVDEDNKRIWIPKGTENGEWVMQNDCVLHDNNNLFGEQLNVLENCEYDDEILDFFEITLNVKVLPSIEDYCKLWKTWEKSPGRQMTHEECCAFWEFVVRTWYSRTEVTFKKNLLKLPVLDPTSSNGNIILVNKGDVFIGDDFFLMDLFQTCSRPIFVWFPQSLTRTKLVEIYTKLGVRTLSESAHKNISDVNHAGFEPVNIIKKGLLKLILAFLANPDYKIGVGKRHEAVSRLLAIEAFETPEKMTVRYSLTLSCGDVVDVEPRRMVRWDKHNSKLFMQKMAKSSSDHETVMEFAFDFAEEIAEGVLWENEELVSDLSELIRSGYWVEFDEKAIEFLMKKKNLQIFVEDQNYLSSMFSSSKPKGNPQETSWAGPSAGQQSTSRPNKRPRVKNEVSSVKNEHNDNSVTSSSSPYELGSTKILKREDMVSVTPVTIIIPD